MWPFKKKNDNISKFTEMIEAVFKENAVKNCSLEPKLNKHLAKTLCSEMRYHGLLDLSVETINDIINRTEHLHLEFRKTNKVMIDKRIAIIELVLRSIMTQPKNWIAVRTTENKKLLFYLKKNDAIKMSYFHKNRHDYSLYVDIFDTKCYIMDITTANNLPIIYDALNYCEHLYNEPEHETLTLAEQYIKE